MIKDAIDFTKHRKKNKEQINLNNIDIIQFIADILHINKTIINVSQTTEIAIISIYDNVISVNALCNLYNIINDKTMYLFSSSNKITLYVDLYKLYNVIKNG